MSWIFDVCRGYIEGKGDFLPEADKKLKLMCSYCKKHDDKFVPDPYYGGPQGFERQFPLRDWRSECGY